MLQEQCVTLKMYFAVRELGEYRYPDASSASLALSECQRKANQADKRFANPIVGYVWARVEPLEEVELPLEKTA